MTSFQWYPGHMAKAKRSMEEDVRLVDAIIELVDARSPLSTRNPDIDMLGRGKTRIIVLNKSDLASERYNKEWVAYFEHQGMSAVSMVSKSGSMKALNAILKVHADEKTAKDLKRGIHNRPYRAMVAGIPNVGKSTFINALAGKNITKTGNRPGVTKGKQWITIGRGLELLDTPGILWPKIDDSSAAFYMALIGSMNDEAINTDELTAELIRLLRERYPDILKEKYGVEEEDDLQGVYVRMAKALNALAKGGAPDTERAAGVLLDSFRSGKLGRITLEFPED